MANLAMDPYKELDAILALPSVARVSVERSFDGALEVTIFSKRDSPVPNCSAIIRVLDLVEARVGPLHAISIRLAELRKAYERPRGPE